jgi:hypothetical protein
VAGRADPSLARVESEHDLAERDLVERALILGLERECHGIPVVVRGAWWWAQVGNLLYVVV